MKDWIIWLVLSVLLGFLHTFNQQRMLAKLGMENNSRTAAWVSLQLLLIWGAAALLIIISLDNGPPAGLAVFAGFLLSRWLSVFHITRRNG